MHFQQLRNSKDPSKVEKERERGRLKYHKYKDRYKTEAQQLKRGLYPSLKNTRAYYEIKGIKFRDEYELHHWNYNRIHDVIELPRRLHRRLHTIIRFEPLEGIYYKGGTRLDSLGAHLSVLQDICLEYGFDYEDIAILIESQKANEIH